MPHDMKFTLLLTLAIIMFIIDIFFCWSLYMTMKKVPKEKQRMPAWTCWLILIPFVGLIFRWILEPFAIPKSLRATVAGNTEAEEATKTLFGVGLADVNSITLSFVPFLGFILAFAHIVFMIIYWIKIVKFRKTYLESPQATELSL